VGSAARRLAGGEANRAVCSVDARRLRSGAPEDLADESLTPLPRNNSFARTSRADVRRRRAARVKPYEGKPGAERGFQRLPDSNLLIAACVVCFTFVLRFMFHSGSPDRAWPHSAPYEGDVPVWMRYAESFDRGLPFQFG